MVAARIATALLSVAGFAGSVAWAAEPAAEELCVGALHSCARRSASIACWGDNSRHQIGASERPQFDAPRIVSEFPRAASLRCGAFETCVLTVEGAVSCLGGPARAERLTLEKPARDVILHERGGCALLVDGTVTCWPRPGTDGAGAPGPVRTLQAVGGISGGSAFVPAPPTATAVCVRRGSQPPICFDTDGGTPAPASGPFAGAIGVVMARSTGSPLCAWFSDGRVACADTVTSGASISAPPALRITGAAIPFDGGFCAAVRETSTRGLTCFGGKPPLLAGLPAGASSLALGDEHACALAGGRIACWGAASDGQLGAGRPYLHARPVPVPGLTDAIQLDASTVQACALRRTGEALCWGQSVDESGRLQSHFAPWSVPLPPGATAVRAAGPAAGTNAVQPLCAQVPAKASKASAARASWQCLSPRGWKTSGPPGGPLAGTKTNRVSRDGRCGLDVQRHLICASPSATGTSAGRPRLASVATGERFRDVVSGLFDRGRAVACGLTDDGRVLCFHVDDGAKAQPVSAPSLAALTAVTQLSAAGQGDDSVACALAEGTVRCWGDGRFEQLGGATPGSVFDAVTIAGLPPVAEVAAGGTFGCARTAAGGVLCWGSNRDGAAPDGAPGSSATPVDAVVKWPAQAAPPRP